MCIFLLTKVRHLRTSYRVLDIEVDGGLGPSTIEAAAQVVICNLCYCTGHLLEAISSIIIRLVFVYDILHTLIG